MILNTKSRWCKVGLIILSFLFTGSTLAGQTTTYFHLDALGSPVAATDETGNVVWKERYRPYGERMDKATSAQSNTRWFTGHPQDSDTGLVYAGARYYDPIVGRFMGVDPIKFQEDNLHSFNVYVYGNNNPYKFVDPDGEFNIFFGIAVAVVLTIGTLALESQDNGTNGCTDCVFSSAASFPTNGLGVVAGIKLTGRLVGKVTKGAPNITKAYKRPSGATTKAQRQSVQGKPCVDCGAKTSKQFADHKDPLVKEYYQTGTIDKTRMRDVGSVQPQCPTCSSRQGAGLSRFSRQMKKERGLE